MPPGPISPPPVSHPVRVRIDSLGVEFDLSAGSWPAAGGVASCLEFPCGGAGLCGACGVRVVGGSLPVTEADEFAFTPQQLAHGWRLACQALRREPASFSTSSR